MKDILEDLKYYSCSGNSNMLFLCNYNMNLKMKIWINYCFLSITGDSKLAEIYNKISTTLLVNTHEKFMFRIYGKY